MGIVYLAREVRLDRLVAVKVLPAALSARAELRERFLREAQTSARLSHPNIVPIYRVDEAGPYVFFAMGYVDGETLAERVRRDGPLGAVPATRMLQEVAWALAYAHARGIVHRDVKPDNILLENGSGRALVTDFGIAQVAAASSITSEGQVMGTAHYMSPEQAAGESVDARSDLYALGVVGYLALSGRLPFDAPNVPAILAQHLTQPVPPLAPPRPVPRALSAAIERCLAKHPEDRFATGENLADALAQPAAGRRELPVALRVWVTKRDPLLPVYGAWSALFSFATFGTAIGAIMNAGPDVSDVLSVFSAALSPLIPLSVFRLTQTRRVLEAGYRADDLELALADHVERQSEEAAFELGQEPSSVARGIRAGTYIALAGTAGVVAQLLLLPSLLEFQEAVALLAQFGIVTVVGGALGLAYPGRRVAPHITGSWRLRFARSGLGRFVTRMTGLGLAQGQRATELPHRPTEAIIGLAASDLYAALPPAVQIQFAELPETLQLLETQARELRARVASLDDMAASVAGHATPSATLAADNRGALQVTDQRASLTVDLQRARELAHARLAQTVAALETIRLDLLRLHAGAGAPSSLTAALTDAHRVIADVAAVISAREEADRIVG